MAHDLQGIGAFFRINMKICRVIESGVPANIANFCLFDAGTGKYQ